MMGAGTRYQKALGIDDDADAMFHDYLQLNRWNVDAGVVRRFCELAGPDRRVGGRPGRRVLRHAGLRRRGTGAAGPRADRAGPGRRRRPRPALPRGRGRRRARPARRPVCSPTSGAVVGVAVGDDAITAGAVVIATGGFGNSPEKLAAYFPSAAHTGSAWYIGAEGSRGDAFDLADQVGAQVVRARSWPAAAACRLRPDLRGVPAGLDRAGQPRRPALRRRVDLVRHPRLAGARAGRRGLRHLRSRHARRGDGRRRGALQALDPGLDEAPEPALERSTSSSRWWPRVG